MARTTRPVRSSTASACALALLAGALALPAGADPPRGNALNPGALDPGAGTDPRGMTVFRETRRRSPSGLTYPYPRGAPEYAGDGDWRWRGSAALSTFFDAGDEGEARFARFTERDDEAFLGGLSLELWNPSSGWRIDLGAGGVGRDDAFYALDVERAGWLRVRASWSRTPHLRANDARSVFVGVGGDTLELAGGLTPGGSGAGTGAAIDAVLAGIEERSLQLLRDRSHVEASLRLLPDLKLVGSWGFEDRRGVRPYGGSFSWPGSATLGGSVETIEAIDDRTQRVRAGLEWAREWLALNLFYEGSFYRNAERDLTFDNPFQLTPGSSVPRGRFASSPDNDRHNLRLDAAITLPLRSSLSAVVSWTRMEQDEDLLAPTLNSGSVGFGGFAVNLDEWNSPAALSRASADAEIDTLLLNVALTSRPLRPLRLRARFQRYRLEDDTRYDALNPLNGFHGYIPEDGGHQTVFNRRNGVFRAVTASQVGDWRFRSVPYEQVRDRYDLDASLRLGRRTRAEVSWRVEAIDREHRQIERTRSDRIRLALHTRALPRTSLRLSWETEQRDGSAVDTEAQRAFRTSSLPGYVPFAGLSLPLGLAALERPDVSDRDRDQVEARAIVALTDGMDLSIAGRVRIDDHGAAYGLRRARSSSLSAEWSWQPSPRRGYHLFGTWDTGVRRQEGIRGVTSATPYVPAAAWAVTSDGRTVTLGAGLRLELVTGLELLSDWVFQLANERVDYRFASDSALAAGVTSAQAGSRFPDQQRREHVVETRLRWRLPARLVGEEGRWIAELYHRLERSLIDDFGQRDLFLRDGNRIYLGHVDGDYTVSVYGVSLIRRF